MEVILIEDIAGTGKAGDKKAVAGGFARNYLLPKGLAIAATPAAIKMSEIHRKAIANRRAKTKDEKTALAQLIESTEVKFQARTGGKEKLYGSITSADVAEKLTKMLGVGIDKKDIKLEAPIKRLGLTEVPLRLAQDITAKIKVVVEEEKAEEVKS